MKPRLLFVLALAAAAATIIPAQTAQARQSKAGLYETLIGERAPAIVSIKLTLRISGTFGEQEQEIEAAGALIGDDGLVLVSNTMVGGDNAYTRSQGITVTPTEVKVLIGDDTEGVQARVVTRDSLLDLAWIQIEEPAEGGYASVSFKNAPKAKPGDRIYVVTRTTEFFGRSPMVNEGHIGGQITKPRALLSPAGAIGPQIGLPVFNDEGVAIGFMIVVTPEEEELAMSDDSADTGIFVLPAADVARATARAREAAAAEAVQPDAAEAGDEGAAEEGEGGN